ncbi:RNA-binding S4 domain-containing protein [Vibrio gazogenes]|uniref:Ribosome-associated protein n=1 Tax=Vibrio gazogenes DSM 21264 = NBRC 103151 TaxID=1123492 RepID=A0A1M5FLL2_VIBGA|nr:RNA-binding S4 domain-containing protein [Vibrio gazogenes]USP14475.1 RNA-binding S4 domain-containing protein [Vibrio gazogenes]SHF92071.1 ribosome-associated protein [Vibrio gazogenes DSM 21264] [Vibrio gazogenes DSM 21264 = NBRC 103151]SJN57459.1 ribosome-associated protein [Vibrio gazogenes]
MQNNEDHADEAAETEIEIEAIGIEVNSQPIELYKVLKIADVVSGGGEAKYAIAEGYVVVNGELELRKRRKMYDGDLVEFNGEYYLVICDVPVAESSQADPGQEQPNQSHQKTSQTTASENTSQRKGKNSPVKKTPASKNSHQSKQGKTNNNELIIGKHYQPEQGKNPAKNNRLTDKKPEKNTPSDKSEPTEHDVVGGRGAIKFF